MELVNLLELPNIFWSDTDPHHLVRQLLAARPVNSEDIQGQFSLCSMDGTSVVLVRDRLGLNKLFYAVDDKTGRLYVANSILQIFRAVGSLEPIFSLAPGHHARIDLLTGKRTIQTFYDMRQHASGADENDFDLAVFQQRVHLRLVKTFESIARQFADHKVIVCLSGGLDSSIIASYAKEYLAAPTTVTFSYSDDASRADSGRDGDSWISSDLVAACSIAEALKLPYLKVLVAPHIDRSELTRVMEACQDWRDFNVHCAWVNHHIAKRLREAFPKQRLLCLTGDLMNEYVADYKPVEFRGRQYYTLPRLPPARLRRFLVYGLDTSDRELGVFHQFGVTTIQPYSALAELYVNVPDSLANRPDAKELLNGVLLQGHPQVYEYVNKTKVRAQVGGGERAGTLELFVDAGIDQGTLRQMWAALFQDAGRSCFELIANGRYRSEMRGEL